MAEFWASNGSPQQPGTPTGYMKSSLRTQNPLCGDEEEAATNTGA